jgi:CheY-like chemotaxis protein
MATIFLVEDDADTAKVTSRILTALKHEVVWLSNAARFMERLQKGVAPALILMDMNMPGLSGDAAIRQVRQIAEYKNTPIVVVSGEEEYVVRSVLGSKINGYLKKPVPVPVLVGKVKEFILE